MPVLIAVEIALLFSVLVVLEIALLFSDVPDSAPVELLLLLL